MINALQYYRQYLPYQTYNSYNLLPWNFNGSIYYEIQGQSLFRGQIWNLCKSCQNMHQYIPRLKCLELELLAKKVKGKHFKYRGQSKCTRFEWKWSHYYSSCRNALSKKKGIVVKTSDASLCTKATRKNTYWINQSMSMRLNW